MFTSKMAHIIRSSITTTRFLAMLLCVHAVAFLSGCDTSAPAKSEVVPDVPIYPKAELVLSRPAEEGDPSSEDYFIQDPTETYHVAGASETEVISWYGEIMAERGWTPITDQSDPVVLYVDSAGCQSFVSIAEIEGGVEIQISQQHPDTPCIPFSEVDPGDD